MRLDLLAPFAGLAIAASASGQVIITEIMADEAGGDVPGEMAEIYNAGGSPVDISGWYLGDEDANFLTVGLPMDTIIAPGEAIVILRSGRNCAQDDQGNDLPEPGDNLFDPELTVADFYAAYGTLNAAGDTYRVFALPNCMTPSLANSASATNEVLGLFDDMDNLVDLANYENGTNDWPGVVAGVSQQLKPQFLDPANNDSGLAWELASAGQNGAVISTLVEYTNPDGILSELIDEGNIASPGYVETNAPFVDCNSNGQDDAFDIFFGVSEDCNGNGVPDECEDDCNGNGTPDACDIADDPSLDCNQNGIVDSCEIADNPSLDSNGNGVLDECELANTVIITEIMYNPSTSPEKEYIEILNVSGSAIDISGWIIADLEGDSPSGGIAAGTMIDPGEAIVLFDADEFFDGTVFDEAGAIAQWESLWGTDHRALPVYPWGSRANLGSPTNEILSITTDTGVIVDVANYFGNDSNGQQQLPWPADNAHSSVYLIGTALDSVANNDGANWRSATPGLDGVYIQNFVPGDAVTANTGEDFGSPGCRAVRRPGAADRPGRDHRDHGGVELRRAGWRSEQPGRRPRLRRVGRDLQ